MGIVHIILGAYVIYEAGLDFAGFEIDKYYFEKQEERFVAHTAQMTLFA